MIDELPNWLDTFLRMFDRALEHGAGYSIIIGWVIAIGLVQWIKRTPWYPSRKWAIRALALPIGFVVTFALWPSPRWWDLSAARFFTALAVGVSASWIYQLVTWVIYKFWPGAEKHLSAAPRE